MKSRTIALAISLSAFFAVGSAFADSADDKSDGADSSSSSSSATSDDSEKSERSERHRKHGRDHDRWAFLERNCVWGLRGSGMDLRGSDADEGTGGASLFTWSDKYANSGIFAYRGSILGMLGGGTAGFEGGLGGGLQWGVHGKFGDNHGPVARIGFDGLMIGNEKLLASYIEVPTTLVGYQYLNGSTIFEIGGRGGAILDGRFNTGNDARRKLGGLDFGSYIAWHTPDARIDVSWMRIVARRSDPKTPVDMIRGSACVYFDVFGSCVDLSYFRGDVQYGFPIQTSLSQALYGGLLIGLREGLP